MYNKGKYGSKAGEIRLHMRTTYEDEQLLEHLCKKTGLTKAGVVRLALRQLQERL